MNSIFDPSCRRCPRLAAFLDLVRHQQPELFLQARRRRSAIRKARLLIVGLAPGMHGANRTGRPFTGRSCGHSAVRNAVQIRPGERSDLERGGRRAELEGARITNSVKCLPPENKPLPLEIKVCNAYLRGSWRKVRDVRVILALGAIAHAAVLRASNLRRASFDSRMAPSTP